MTFNPQDIAPPAAKIKVIGIGGGGGNAINTMVRSRIDGVDFITVNTDIQALGFSEATTKIQIGKELTKGLGAGADPDVGRDAALEDRHSIQESLEGANMVFVTAGMGGGTGTGGASIIAQIARDMGALTVGVVTKPFMFEGKRRQRLAEMGIARLQENVDTLITIPNQRLLQIAQPDLSMIDAFRMADNVLVNAVKGISDIINVPGTVNVDFADVKAVMSSMGLALMGIGIAEGENRAVEAAHQAISSPLLEDVDIEGATGILINITAGENITLMEVNQACSIVQEAAHEDANIIFGAVFDANMGEKIQVTVIATGFPSEDQDETSKPAVKEMQADRFRASRVYPTKNLSSKPQTSRNYPKAAAPTFSNPIRNHFEQAVSSPTPRIDPLPTAREKAVASENEYPFNAHELVKITLDDKITRPTSDLSDLEFSDEIEPNFMINPSEAQNLENTDFNKIFGATRSDQDEIIHAIDADLSTSAKLFSDGDETQTAVTDLAFTAENAQHDAEEKEYPQGDATDKKIDQALELAERITTEKTDNGDNLDIPAFLRNGMKDLSLS